MVPQAKMKRIVMASSRAPLRLAEMMMARRFATNGLASSAAPVLPSKVNPQGEAFSANSEAMRKLLETLRAHIATAQAGGLEAAKAKHKARGMFLARERIEELVDPGSPFLELSPLAAHGMYEKDGPVPSAGIITGVGVVSGIRCVIVANDATVKGGVYYFATMKKHLRAQEVALENNLPCIYLVDSGGGHLGQDVGDGGFADKTGFGRIFFNQVRRMIYKA